MQVFLSIFKYFKYFQVFSSIFNFCHVLSSVVKYFQVFSSIFYNFQVISRIFKNVQVFLSIFKYFQVIQVFSSIFGLSAVNLACSIKCGSIQSQIAFFFAILSNLEDKIATIYILRTLVKLNSKVLAFLSKHVLNSIKRQITEGLLAGLQGSHCQGTISVKSKMQPCTHHHHHHHSSGVTPPPPGSS